MPDDQIVRERALLSLTSPLGRDVLIPISATVEEALNEPFLCAIEAVSARDSIDPDRLLHQEACLHLTPRDGEPRYVHGLVRRFEATGRDRRGMFAYRLELVPRLWFLDQAEDCRTFQDMTGQDILHALLEQAGVTDTTFTISNGDEQRPLTVQFNETLLAFFTRVIEERGWCYAFRHTATKHTLLVADSVTAFGARPERAVSLLGPQAAGELASWRAGRRTAWGGVVTADYNADEALMHETTATTFTTAGAAQRIVMHWPAGVRQPGELVKHGRQVMEAAEAAAMSAEGEGFDPSFQPGARILVAPDREAKTEYVLLRVVHEIHDDTWSNANDATRYRNRFVAHPVSLPWRKLPSVPRPRMHGIYSAEVLGPQGEEIHTDTLGRVKVRFRWDLNGNASDGGGVWVGVVQPWGGGGAGWLGIPRVGCEVAVSFMDGDPDRPVVVGQLYSKKDPPPLALPANKTRTGLRTRSTPNGDSTTFSELWFDDKKGSELVLLHAEKDLSVEVENNATYAIDQDRSVTVKQGNDKLTVQNGNRTVDVPLGNHSITSNTGNISLKTQAGAITLEAMQSITLKVGQSSVTIDQTGVAIKGMLVSAEGQAMASLKGPMIKLDADAMLDASAGIMMLN